MGGGGGGSDVMNTIISAKIIATFMCLPSENAHQCCQMAGFCSVVKRFKFNIFLYKLESGNAFKLIDLKRGQLSVNSGRCI